MLIFALNVVFHVAHRMPLALMPFFMAFLLTHAIHTIVIGVGSIGSHLISRERIKVYIIVYKLLEKPLVILLLP